MPVSRIAPELIDRSFGLLAIVEDTRVRLPLKAVECEFFVAAGLVEVRLTQVFRQENPKPLDCDYLFPLPADASVYACEADINGRIIHAQVKERGEAARLAEEKKAEGRRVALVESERPNLFTLSLKNLQPDDLVLVTLKYIQPLRHLAELASVEIPFCPGIRYIPGNPLLRSNRGRGSADDTDQVPDASRISPVRMDREHPDAAFIEIRGRLDGQFVEAASLISPSHNIVSRPEGDQVTIRLSDHGEVPDRDFVLRWKETNAEQLVARAWIQEVGAQTYALMEIRAPKATGAPVPMDFYFLVDISGSMAGLKWQKAAQAVQACVSGLATQDRVMLTLFNNGVRDFAEQPLSPARVLADVHFQQLHELQANGGTELGQAIRHVLELAAVHSPDHNKVLILITDAQVGNEAVILHLAKAAPDFPMHCFGLDIALNDALLLALARQQRGTFHSLKPGDEVVKIVSDLAQTIRHPVLRGLSLPAGWETDVACLPPLYSGQVFHLGARCACTVAVNVSSRLNPLNPGRKPLELTAQSQTAEPVAIPLTCLPAAGPAPYLHWCKHRIQRLMEEGKPAEAIALSVQSNLICPVTAFIAWDESEKVAVASQALAQPNLEIEVLKATLRRDMAGNQSPRVATLGRAYLDGLVGSRFDAEKQMRLREAPMAARSDQPQDVVRKIVEVPNGFFASMPAAPCPDPQARATAFDACFREISQRCCLRESEGEFLAVRQWAFADPQRWLERSTLVAALLWNLLKLADQHTLVLRPIDRLLFELERKHGRPRGTAIRVGSAIVARSWTEAELLAMIEAEFNERVDPRPVADYVRLRREMQQAIEAFARQHLKT
jgi:Ca-activated chloride channel family protein